MIVPMLTFFHNINPRKIYDDVPSPRVNTFLFFFLIYFLQMPFLDFPFSEKGFLSHADLNSISKGHGSNACTPSSNPPISEQEIPIWGKLHANAKCTFLKSNSPLAPGPSGPILNI